MDKRTLELIVAVTVAVVELVVLVTDAMREKK